MNALTDKKFWEDALVRAIRTMAQAAIGIIGSGAAMSDVNWLRVLSGSALAGLVSVLMSLDRIGTPQTPSQPATIPEGTMRRLQTLAGESAATVTERPATIIENGGNDHD